MNLPNEDLKKSEESKQFFPLEEKSAFNRTPSTILILAAILLGTLFIVFLLFAFKPEAEKRPIPETVVSVDVVPALRKSHPINVHANGTIAAETRGNLVAQIRGEIVSVAENFNTGGSFKKGDVLIQIDQRDYQAELSRARAQLSQANAAYRQERANARQAEQDWRRLGNKDPAPELVLRKPQLAAAQAQLESARAASETAELNLSRTTLTAPYDGRIIRRLAVLGQYVGVGTPIAEVFATDKIELRLPISQEEFVQLGLDRFANDATHKVTVISRLGNRSYQWNAHITRTDSTFDINTRQIDVIAEIENPFSIGLDQPPLKIGQFVSATIEGQAIDNVFVIPNKSIREGRYIYVVRDERLEKQTIEPLWQDDQFTLVAEGLEQDDLIVTTSLSSTLAGAKAKIAGEPTSELTSELEHPESSTNESTSDSASDATASRPPDSE